MPRFPFSNHQRLIRSVFLSLVLVLTTVAVYLPVRHCEFVGLDDNSFVTENSNIQSGLTWRSVHWALTAGFPHYDSNADYWRPVSYLSHVLDIEMFGLHPAGHHLMNVGFHAAAAVALFLVLQSMTNAPWCSAFVAGLFALHPLRVESVAWVTERKDVLSGLFFMLTLGAYTRYVRSPFSLPRYLTVVVVFALALMCKSMVVTLPFVLLLLDYWPLGRTRWVPPVVAGTTVTVPPSRLLSEKLPLFALAAASSAMTFWAVRGTGGDYFRQPLRIRIGNAVLSYVGYIGKMFWPTGLSVLHPLRLDLSAAAVIAAGVGLLGVTAAVIWKGRLMPWLVTGWFWYLGMLAPVIGVLQVASEPMADRFPYIPMVGLFIVLGWSVPSPAMERRAVKVITGVVVVAILAACAVLSRIQVGYWKDTETLFGHALSVSRDNWLAQYNLGVALQRAGRMQEAMEHWEQALRIRPDYIAARYNLGIALGQAGRVQEAMGQWEQALRIKPDFAGAHNVLGVALEQSGKREDAIGHYEQAVRIKPDFVEARNNLGLALLQLGRAQEAIGHFEQAVRTEPNLPQLHYNLGLALGQVGRLQEAVGQWEQAVRIKPDFVEAHHQLGDALLLAGKVQDAVRHYEQALQIRPDLVQVHCGLGTALEQAGRLPEAIEHYQQAVRIKPDFAEAHYDLGNALMRVGQVPEAIGQYEQALQIEPDYADAHNNLGNALLQAGGVEGAIQHFEQALRIRPDYAEAHYNLGNALMHVGQVPEAIRHFEQALRIRPDFAEAQYNLGAALEEMGRVPEAIERYEQALRLRPDLTAARNALARLATKKRS